MVVIEYSWFMSYQLVNSHQPMASMIGYIPWLVILIVVDTGND